MYRKQLRFRFAVLAHTPLLVLHLCRRFWLTVWKKVQTFAWKSAAKKKHNTTHIHNMHSFAFKLFINMKLNATFCAITGEPSAAHHTTQHGSTDKHCGFRVDCPFVIHWLQRRTGHSWAQKSDTTWFNASGRLDGFWKTLKYYSFEKSDLVSSLCKIVARKARRRVFFNLAYRNFHGDLAEHCFKLSNKPFHIIAAWKARGRISIQSVAIVLSCHTSILGQI